MLGKLIKDELDQEVLAYTIMRESVVSIFGGGSGSLQEYDDLLHLHQNRLEEWQRQVACAADLRNALAHGDKGLLSMATCDEAGTRLQFIGEMINRVCGGRFVKQAKA